MEKTDPNQIRPDGSSDEADRVLTNEAGDEIPDVDGEPITIPPEPKK